MRLALTIFLCSSLATNGADWYPSASRIDFTAAGVPGGIPTGQTVYTTLTSDSTASQIQTAINNCPTGQVVKLAPGTFTMNATLRINRDGVTLRGSTNSSGEPTSILNFNSSLTGNQWGLIDISKSTYPTWSVTTRTVSSGVTRDSTSVTLGTAPTGLTVGQILTFDQLADDSLIWDNGTEGGGTWGRSGSQPARTYMQFVRVASIAGTTVTFAPGIYGSTTYWTAPAAYYWDTGFNNIVNWSGVEDLWIVRPSGGDGTHNVAMGPAYACWVKNVRSRQCDDAHIRTAFTLNCEIRDNIMGVHDDNGSATYSVWLTFATATRVENNAMTNTPCGIGMMSCQGTVVIGNVCKEMKFSSANWLPECIMLHGGHCNFNYFAHNYTPSFWADWIHGNGSFDAYVRNRCPGWETGKTGSTRPINIEEQQDNFYVLGNIFGTDSYHDNYNTSGDTKILNIDSDSAATLVLRGNYNTVNDGINAAEAVGSDTISNCYAYSSKPGYYGVMPWPPFDYTAPTRALTAKAWTNLPVGLYLETGSWPSADGGEGPPPDAPASPVVYRIGGLRLTP